VVVGVVAAVAGDVATVVDGVVVAGDVVVVKRAVVVVTVVTGARGAVVVSGGDAWCGWAVSGGDGRTSVQPG
jgi:hypothetical protein